MQHDHLIPLPAAQAPLVHASVRTTAGNAKTDLAQLCALVDATFSRRPCSSIMLPRHPYAC
jgi:hypothetical protein